MQDRSAVRSAADAHMVYSQSAMTEEAVVVITHFPSATIPKFAPVEADHLYISLNHQAEKT